MGGTVDLGVVVKSTSIARIFSVRGAVKFGDPSSRKKRLAKWDQRDTIESLRADIAVVISLPSFKMFSIPFLVLFPPPLPLNDIQRTR